MTEVFYVELGADLKGEVAIERAGAKKGLVAVALPSPAEKGISFFARINQNERFAV